MMEGDRFGSKADPFKLGPGELWWHEEDNAVIREAVHEILIEAHDSGTLQKYIARIKKNSKKRCKIERSILQR